MHINARFLFRRGMPFFMCLVLILCNMVPYSLLPRYPHAFQWVLIPIFYFAIYNPKLLSAWAVFILTLFAELFVQSPWGILTFTYMYFIANFLRKYLVELVFWSLWGVFCAVLLSVELISAGLMEMLARYPLSIQPALIEFLGLVLVYPFMMRFCAHLDRKARESQ